MYPVAAADTADMADKLAGGILVGEAQQHTD
jgi:hypothetical protein